MKVQLGIAKLKKSGLRANLFIDDCIQPGDPFDPYKCLELFPDKDKRVWNYREMPEEAKTLVFGKELERIELKVPILERQEIKFFERKETVQGVVLVLENNYEKVIFEKRCYWDLRALGEDEWWEKWGEYLYCWINEEYYYDPSLGSDWGGFGFGGRGLMGQEA